MNCTICMELFDESQRRPKVLSCGHSFCSQCLHSLPKKECPVDRRVFKDNAKLPDNFMLLQLTDRPETKPAAVRRRFWCLDCEREAPDACEEEHSVCSLSKARSRRAQPCVEALRAGSAALAGLRGLLHAARPELAAELDADAARLGRRQKELDEAASAVEAALLADEAAFELWLAAATAAKRGVLHEDVYCDDCQAQPLRGIRWKCRACPNFDLCSACYLRGCHDPSHPFFRIETAGGERVEVCPRASGGTPMLANGVTSPHSATPRSEGGNGDTLGGAEGLPRYTARLLAALADPASECSVALEAAGGVWRGSVRPREDAAARLLLCRLLCDDGLQPPVHAQGGGQEEQRPGSVSDFVVPADAPRWPERSNGTGVEWTFEEMAARMRAGSRVVRGRDWGAAWTFDGSPPGAGTVTKKGVGTVDVKWDCGGNVYEYNNGAKGQYQLRLLLRVDEFTIPDDIQKNSPAYLDVDAVSSGTDINAKTKLLAGEGLSQVRALVGLRCNVSPTWSGLVLEKAAASLELLQLRSPDTEHLCAVTVMPRLHSLHLDSVTPATLRLALSVPSLRRLEVHCSPDAPLVAGQGGQGLRLPVAPALEWLRVGVYPLAAALAVARAHAATLRELELVAASDRPYGCPDLAKELADCGLRNLHKLVLRRDSPQHICAHNVESCGKQKMELWDMYLKQRQSVEFMCDLCDGMV